MNNLRDRFHTWLTSLLTNGKTLPGILRGITWLFIAGGVWLLLCGLLLPDGVRLVIGGILSGIAAVVVDILRWDIEREDWR